MINETEVKELMSDNNIYTSFANSESKGDNDSKYLPIKSFDELNSILIEKLNEYNENKP